MPKDDNSIGGKSKVSGDEEDLQVSDSSEPDRLLSREKIEAEHKYYRPPGRSTSSKPKLDHLNCLEDSVMTESEEIWDRVGNKKRADRLL
jgi:hypothetical protein